MLSPIYGALCDLHWRCLSIMHILLYLNSQLGGLYFESQFVVWDYQGSWHLIELVGHYCSSRDVAHFLSRFKGVVVNVWVYHLLGVDWRHPTSYLACEVASILIVDWRIVSLELTELGDLLAWLNRNCRIGVRCRDNGVHWVWMLLQLPCHGLIYRLLLRR